MKRQGFDFYSELTWTRKLPGGYPELASRLPRQGGTYIFIREGIGEAAAFLYIISRVLLLNPCSQVVVDPTHM